MSSNNNNNNNNAIIDACLASTFFTSRYQFIRLLFPSHFGGVIHAYHYQRHCDVIVKVSNKSLASNNYNDIHSTMSPNTKIQVEDVFRETNIMSYINTIQRHNVLNNNKENDGSEYIVKLLEYASDEENNLYYQVWEYCEHGDLLTILSTSGPMNEKLAKRAAKQIAKGIHFLHKNHIAHVDLSLENICLSKDGKLKLIDFGLSAIHPKYNNLYNNHHDFIQCVQLHQDQATHSDENEFPCQFNYTRPGKLGYMSPELFNNPVLLALANTQNNTNKSRSSSSSSVSSFHSATKSPSIHAQAHHETDDDIDNDDNDDHMHNNNNNYFSERTSSAHSTITHKRSSSSSSKSSISSEYWDAYSNDVFSFGIILYSLLCLRRPFTSASYEDADFMRIYSGEWMLPQHKNDVNNVFYGLSDDALSLLDSIFKPQQQRPDIQTILKHKWFQEQSETRANTH